MRRSGAMFIKERDRRFCPACSKTHQTYQYRKAYLLKKKKEYYERDTQHDE